MRIPLILCRPGALTLVPGAGWAGAQASPPASRRSCGDGRSRHPVAGRLAPAAPPRQHLPRSLGRPQQGSGTRAPHFCQRLDADQDWRWQPDQAAPARGLEGRRIRFSSSGQGWPVRSSRSWAKLPGGRSEWGEEGPGDDLCSGHRSAGLVALLSVSKALSFFCPAMLFASSTEIWSLSRSIRCFAASVCTLVPCDADALRPCWPIVNHTFHRGVWRRRTVTGGVI